MIVGQYLHMYVIRGLRPSPFFPSVCYQNNVFLNLGLIRVKKKKTVSSWKNSGVAGGITNFPATWTEKPQPWKNVTFTLGFKLKLKICVGKVNVLLYLT